MDIQSGKYWINVQRQYESYVIGCSFGRQIGCIFLFHILFYSILFELIVCWLFLYFEQKKMNRENIRP